VKRILPLILLILVAAGCNLPARDLSPFIAPAGSGTATPDWAATLQAAIPTQNNAPPAETPDPQQPGVTATPIVLPPTARPISEGPLLYYTQAGDTLDAIAVRFGVTIDQISSPDPIPERGFINPNQLLIIPNVLANTTPAQHLLPDSELVYSLSAIDFDTASFVEQAGGYLSDYSEYLGTAGQSTGAQVVELIALDNSINPRLLLALLEFQAGWVRGQPGNLAQREYPFGLIDLDRKGLLYQMKWAVNQLSIGYYDWREGRLSEVTFTDGQTVRLAPDLNAGTAALHYYFAQLYDSQGWLAAIDPVNGFPALYQQMFGNPWVRAQSVEPLFPPDLAQPHLELPFLIGPVWSYTGGPHGAWEREGSWAAIDFSPAREQSGCVESDAYVTAAAAGLVVRSERGIVVLDLDGDGLEQTGWNLVYLHIATDLRIPLGSSVETGDFLGNPSCEGGVATGTHIHLARKYNGEWMAADGPIPFVLSGWQVHAGSAPYKGTLTRGEETVTASSVGAFTSRIVRDHSEGSQ
jgi:LysM repeat protein